MDYQDYIQTKNKEGLHFWFRAKNNLIFALLKKTLGEAGRDKREILDIGCGTGTELSVLKKFGRVTALDKNTDALELVKKTGCYTLGGDIEKIKLEKNKFDAVCCFDILEHLKNDLGALKNIYDSLNKNGILFFTVPAGPFLFGPHDIALRHMRRYNKKSLKLIFRKAGFTDIKIMYWNTFLYPLEAVFRISKKIIYKILKNNKIKSEAGVPNRYINYFLYRILDFENYFVAADASMPFGLTLYGVCKK